MLKKQSVTDGPTDIAGYWFAWCTTKQNVGHNAGASLLLKGMSNVIIVADESANMADNRRWMMTTIIVDESDDEDPKHDGELWEHEDDDAKWWGCCGWWWRRWYTIRMMLEDDDDGKDDDIFYWCSPILAAISRNSHCFLPLLKFQSWKKKHHKMGFIFTEINVYHFKPESVRPSFLSFFIFLFLCFQMWLSANFWPSKQRRDGCYLDITKFN